MDWNNTGNASGMEIVHCIEKAGIRPDRNDLTQLAKAIRALGGIDREEIQEMIDQAVRKISPYKICEVYYFRDPTLSAGFRQANGDVVTDAATLHPQAWAYLQTADGQALCKTEAEWQAMTQATWATLADGTTVGWDGIGGAPFYVQDLDAGTLRLPDLRGMYAEAAGFDGLEVGGVHGDGTRRLEGSVDGLEQGWAKGSGTGAQRVIKVNSKGASSVEGIDYFVDTDFDSARVVPTANKNQPRAWGALACVYLGTAAF